MKAADRQNRLFTQPAAFMIFAPPHTLLIQLLLVEDHSLCLDSWNHYTLNIKEIS